MVRGARLRAPYATRAALLATLTVLAVAALVEPAAAARRRLVDSPHLAAIPPPGACDVVITPKNQDTTIPMLNDPDKRVFCVDPGNYRQQGHPEIRTSGTAAAPRYLRYNAPFPAPHAYHQERRAYFHGLALSGASHWVVEGITIRPTDPQDRNYLLSIFSGSHNVVTRSYLDASRQPNHTHQSGIVIGANRDSGASTYNEIRQNVIQGGNKNRVPVDYTGIAILSEDEPGKSNSYNRILDNEIFDWGDGIQLVAKPPDCNLSGSWPKATLIDGNDIYIRRTKYVDCATGQPDPQGECSCSENGIDIKSPGGSNIERWTRITNNRLWGFRPTLRDVPSCGGSGARGTAINAGNSCAGYVLVANNVITDSTSGIVTQGEDWVVVGNLVNEVRDTQPIAGFAIYPLSRDTRVHFNTIVSVDNAYADSEPDVVATCNVAVADASSTPRGDARGDGHIVARNLLYGSATPDLISATAEVYPSETDSGNATLCVERRRFTNPEPLCIPFAHATRASPHEAKPPGWCGDDPTAAFGLPDLRYP